MHFDIKGINSLNPCFFYPQLFAYELFMDENCSILNIYENMKFHSQIYSYVIGGFLVDTNVH